MKDLHWIWLLAFVPACSAGSAREDPGRAAQALGPGYYIGNVVVDPATYHFIEPQELLTTAEGAGPRTLNIAVSAAVTPHIAFTGTHTPSHTDLSEALGWDVARTVQLTADSSVLVPVNAYARVDAYTTYQKTTFTMIGIAQVPLGMGTIYKPVGVYFSTCGCIGPDPCGSGCASGFPWGGQPSASTSQPSPVSQGGGETDGGATDDGG